MKRKVVIFIVALCAVFCCTTSKAQQINLKTNLLYDLTATVNLGIEMTVAPRWSVDISGNFNGWMVAENARWKHWMVQPEVRYWFCDPFGGHFVGLHAQGGVFNVGGIKNNIDFLGTNFSRLTDSRFQGWFAGGGIGYGYSWILSRHWNLEAEIGVGYIYSKYDRYECAGCGKLAEADQVHHYIGPTKAAINLVFVF